MRMVHVVTNSYYHVDTDVAMIGMQTWKTSFKNCKYVAAEDTSDGFNEAASSGLPDRQR